jgi:hypothetical protein
VIGSIAAERNDGVQVSVSVCHRVADGRNFAAYVCESDIRFNMDARKYLSALSPQSGGYLVPPWMVERPPRFLCVFNQFQILDFEFHGCASAFWRPNNVIHIPHTVSWPQLSIILRGTRIPVPPNLAIAHRELAGAD